MEGYRAGIRGDIASVTTVIRKEFDNAIDGNDYFSGFHSIEASANKAVIPITITTRKMFRGSSNILVGKDGRGYGSGGLNEHHENSFYHSGFFTKITCSHVQ